MLRTASVRLAALYLLLFTASAVLLGAVVFWTTHTALEEQLRARITGEIASLRADYATGGIPRLLADVETRGRGSGSLDYLVVDSAGRRLGGVLSGHVPRLGWQRLKVREDDDEAQKEAQKGVERETLQALAVSLGDGLVLAVGDDADRVAEVEEAILRAFIVAAGLTIVLGAAGGAWLGHMFLRQVDTIGRTAEAIIAGDLGRRIPVRSTGDDLDRLAVTLNRMLDRIAGLMENVRQVSNDIAHDLRTPLSRLRRRLDEARDRAGSAADYERAIDGALVEVEALLATFAALLRIAQIEAGAQRAAFRQVDLSTLTETVAEAFAPAVEDERHEFVTEIAADVAICGDQELLTQMLANLVENALRHTPAGSRVRVALARTPGSGICLTVEDDGPGVPEAERGRIVRRFYRLEQSRTTPGNGLGLSLVVAVAELHGAGLLLEDARPGLRVSVVFAEPAPA